MFDILNRLQDHLRRGFKDLLPAQRQVQIPVLENPIPHAMVWGVAPTPAHDFSSHDIPKDDQPLVNPEARTTDHRRFTFIKTVLEKSGFDAARIERVQSDYEKTVAANKVWISEKDEVEGWRRVASIGIGRASWHLMGVTDAGLFVTASAYNADGETDLHPRDAARRLRDGDLRGMTFTNVANFSFNLHSRAFREYWQPFANARQIGFNAATLQNPHGDPGTPARAKLKGMARQHVQSRARIITRMLWGELDPDVRYRMRSSLSLSGFDAQWLAGGNVDAVRRTQNSGSLREISWEVDPSLGVARRQAAAAFPILTQLMMDYDDIAAAVDNRAPLIPALAVHFETSQEGIRALQGLTWQKAGCSPSSVPVQSWLALPAAQMPETRKEFQAYARMIDYANKARMDTDLLRKRARGKFIETLHQLERVDPASLRDHLEDVFRRLTLPKLVSDRPELRKMLLGDIEKGWQNDMPWTTRRLMSSFVQQCMDEMGPKDLVEASLGWHKNLGSIDRDLGVDVKGAGWSPMLGSSVTPKGLEGRELLSLPDLRRQGQTQHHCVGTYGGKVTGWKGEPGSITLIFSIEREGMVLSTAEFHLSVNYPRDKETKEIAGPLSVMGVQMIQNRARHNGAAPAETEAAITQIRKDLLALPAPALEAYAAGLRDWSSQSRDEGVTRLSEILNANLDDPDYLEKAWARLSPVLPRALRKAGLGGFLAHPMLNDFSEALEDARREQEAASARFKKKPAPLPAARRNHDGDVDPETPF